MRKKSGKGWLGHIPDRPETDRRGSKCLLLLLGLVFRSRCTMGPKRNDLWLVSDIHRESSLLARWLSRHTKVSRLGRIRGHVCCRSYLLYRHTQAARLAFQSETDLIHGAVEREDGRIDDQIIELRVLML